MRIYRVSSQRSLVNVSVQGMYDGRPCCGEEQPLTIVVFGSNRITDFGRSSVDRVWLMGCISSCKAWEGRVDNSAAQACCAVALLQHVGFVLQNVYLVLGV
ncbi:hypothetical protein BDQ94DRAFT_155954, partial [Aspergillus welwitschiae]